MLTEDETQRSFSRLERRAHMDVHRIAELLGGMPDPGRRSLACSATEDHRRRRRRQDVSTGSPPGPTPSTSRGSVSKTWTALTFMRFVDEGKADLDELSDLPARLPGGRPRRQRLATCATLLNHTSGIEEDFEIRARATTSTNAWSPTSPTRRQVVYHAGPHPRLQRGFGLRGPRPRHGGDRRAAVGRRRQGPPVRPLGPDLDDQPPRTRRRLPAATGHLVRSLEEAPDPVTAGPPAALVRPRGQRQHDGPRPGSRWRPSSSTRGWPRTGPGSCPRGRPGDDRVAGARPRPLHVRGGVGARPHRRRLARPDRLLPTTAAPSARAPARASCRSRTSPSRC